jgi:hypothetical protein
VTASPDTVARLDVVVVSYNSRDRLRKCVAHLASADRIRVTVVDNASADGSLEALEDIAGILAIRLPRNVGFGAGCNEGWRAGASPYVVFLNPDAWIDSESLLLLADTLDQEPRAAIAAPRLVDAEGANGYGLRRFPTLVTTYAQALFLHRLRPSSRLLNEIVYDEEAYATAGSPDWVVGACMAVRRSVLERLGGFDETFFMYCEDMDLCWRARRLGFDVLYVPDARCVHEGGASAPRAELLPTLATSRVLFARKRRRRLGAFVEICGIGIDELAHCIVTRDGLTGRLGHARALGAVAKGMLRPGSSTG